MLNKKLLKTLRRLNKPEFLAFEKYLTKKLAKQAIALSTFKYLKRFFPAFTDAKRLDITYAYKKVFKQSIDEKPYNRKNFLNTLSDIYSCLKEFLILQKIDNPSIESRLLWATILLERGLNDEFNRSITALQFDINQLTPKGIPDYLSGLTANYLYYYKAIQKKLEPQIDTIQYTVNYLDNYYTIIRLKLACEEVAREKVLNIIDMQNSPILKFKSSLFPKNSTNPLLSMYYLSYQLLTKGSNKYYENLTSLLKKNKNDIDKEEQHILLSYLQNYTSSQLRNGDTSFWIKSHELNIFGVEQNLFARKGLISHTQFNNIVNTACKVKEFNWVSEFMNEHEDFLDESVRKNTMMLSKAILHYEMKKFDQILPLLFQVEFIDTHQAIRAKALILITYVELNWKKEIILNFCISFSSYLKRNKKLKEETLLATINFIKIAKLLYLKQEPKEAVISQIKSTKPLYFDLWLLEKAREL